MELKPRGRMFGRLGTAKMKHEWGVEVSDIVCCLNNMTKISASVGMIYCQKGSSLARGREGKKRGKYLQHSGCSFVEIIHGRVLHLAFVFCMFII